MEPKLYKIVATSLCLLSAASFALGQQSPSKLPSQPIIVVTGNGETDVQPDQAVVSLGAIAQEKDAAAAQQKVNQIVQKSIDALTALGIKKEKIHTQSLTLRPVYKQFPPNDEHRQPTIIGYEASNTLQITLDDLTQIAPAIDAGVAAGADNIEGVDFQLVDDTDATDQALSKATRQAGNKANAIAQALGVAVDKAIEVDEGGVQRVMPMMEMASMAKVAGSFNTPVQAGQIKITATVTVTYRIK